MAIAEHIGYDATGRPEKDEFQEILNVWRKLCEVGGTWFKIDNFHAFVHAFARKASGADIEKRLRGHP
jgi:hypothetical protein